MSTQDATGIEFSVLPEEDQQQFRLLELPPELLELLASDNAPILHLKSAESTPSQTADAPAVVCTADKTYTLRQVNTSNSLYITHSSPAPGDSLPNPSLNAIAKADFTLELQAVADAEAATHIRRILPVYASTGHFSSKNATSKTVLFGNVPASEAECEQAWTELACFELDGEALIPSASVKVKVWESIFSAATAEAIDLTSPLLSNDIEALVDLNGSQWPRELSLAVLRSMTKRVQEIVHLDQQTCAKHIGRTLLKDRAEHTSLPKATFLSAWADLLPEQWRSSADLSLLEGSYRLENGGVVFDDGEGKGAGAMASGAKAPAEAKSALGAKRKWHEKFRGAAKKTA